MHTHNVVHRDLTSNNLLVTDKWEAKVMFPAQAPSCRAPHAFVACMISRLRHTLGGLGSAQQSRHRLSGVTRVTFLHELSREQGLTDTHSGYNR